MKPGAGTGGAAHPGGTGDDEAPKDPGARITHQSYTEKDYEGHRAHTVYVGVHLPGERRHRRHHKHHHSQRQSYPCESCATLIDNDVASCNTSSLMFKQ